MIGATLEPWHSRAMRGLLKVWMISGECIAMLTRL